MTDTTDLPVYEISINVRVGWQAHSLSNAGSNGSNRLFPRRQLLADGTETDACSGNIAKHHHAVLTAEYMEEAGVPLCAACANRDGRRAAALMGSPDYTARLTMAKILSGCGLCDAHGFLVTAKKANSAENTVARQRLSKHSLIEFSFALALPEQHSDSTQLFTRQGDSKEEGQMLMKMTARSGQYALNVRYASVGVGMDTDKWIMVVNSRDERLRRHHAILLALRDYILSPTGALTATMLPHLTSALGAIVVRKTVGRAAIYSGLQDDFIDRLMKLSDESMQVMPFHSVDEYHLAMNQLITSSEPYVMTRNGSTSTARKRSAPTPTNRTTRNKR